MVDNKSFQLQLDRVLTQLITNPAVSEIIQNHVRLFAMQDLQEMSVTKEAILALQFLESEGDFRGFIKVYNFDRQVAVSYFLGMIKILIDVISRSTSINEISLQAILESLMSNPTAKSQLILLLIKILDGTKDRE